MILMRGTNDATYGSHSRVLFYGYDDAKIWRWDSSDDTDGLPTAGKIFNAFPDSSDLFCSGHSGLPDGRILVTGGNETPGPGIDHTNIFLQASNNPSQTWVSPRPQNMNENRWYPTNTALPDGKVLVLSGLEGVQVCAFGGVNSSGTPNNDFVLFGLRGIPVHSTPADANPPGARQEHSAVFDGALRSTCLANFGGFADRQRMIVFGGYSTSSSSPSNDVWALSRTVLSDWSWNQLSPDPDPVHGTPAARSSHVAVFFPADSSMVIQGGLDAGGNVLDDVWKLYLYRELESTCVWRGYWRRLSTGGDSDLKRYNHTAVYDPVNQTVVIFGGRTTSGFASTDVWSFALSGTPAWTKLTTTGTPPSAREGHGAVFDLLTDANNPRMLIVGGRNGSTFYSSVTELKNGAWSSLTATGGPPSGRAEFSLTHDTYVYSNNRLVLFGGENAGGALGDVWDFQLSTSSGIWTQRIAAVASGPRARHTAIHDTRYINATRGEIFDPTILTGNPWTQLGTDYRRWMALYPLMFVLPSGKIAHVGPEQNSNLLDLTTPSSAWTGVGGNGIFNGGTAVMYLPGKVLKCGAEDGWASDESAHIDFSQSSPSWTLHTGGIGNPRTKHNLTILANGQILLSGGMSTYLENAIDDKTYSELLDLAERSVKIWSPTSSTWGGNLAQDPALRDYHSTAILLPDGKVLSGGGEHEHNPDRLLASVYWPPYLFDDAGAVAPRPVISAIDDVVTYGNSFSLWLSDTTGIAKVSLIKPSAVTHQFNQDQRYLEASITCSVVEGGRRKVTVDGPPSGNHAPPGDYMVFAIKWNGVPSVARWVRVMPEITKTGQLTSQVWEAGKAYYLSGTVVVPSSVTLTIQPGVWIRAASGAALKVDGGTLSATGARFVGSGCSGTWAGIKIVDAHSATITECRIRDAEIGVDFSDGSGGGTVQSCYFENPRTVGIHVNHTATVTLDRDTVDCPLGVTGFIGISVGDQAEGSTTITRCRIQGKNASGSKGLLIKDVVTIRGTQIKDFNATNARGIEFVLAAEDTSASLTMDIESSSPADTTAIRNCRTGIYIDSYSRPVIRRVRIDNTTQAFWVKPLAQPDIGTDFDHGFSDVSNSSSKHVKADTRYSGIPNIDALNNYWGTTSSSAIAAKMEGSVNWDPFLGSDPLSTLDRRFPGSMVEGIQLKPTLIGNAPNPFFENTRIRFVVDRDAVAAEISIFDVAGRIVRTRNHESLSAGEHELDWNATNDNGGRVVPGVYLYRLRVGEVIVGTKRMLVLPWNRR